MLPERSAYAIGDRVAFDVLLTNVSGQAINVPWPIEGERFTRKMPGARRPIVALEFTHPVLGGQSFGWHTLFDADGVGDSLRLIQPNETLLIHAETPFQLARGWTEAVVGDWVREVRPAVTVILAIPSEYYPPGMSSNRLKVALAKR